MYGLGNCSNGSPMFSPMVLPPASAAPRLAASIMPGPPPEQTTKRCVPFSVELGGPLGEHAGQRARILVILRQGPSSRIRAEPKNTTVSRIFSRRKMRQRLQKLGQQPDGPRVRAVQKLLVQVGDRLAVARGGLWFAIFESHRLFFFNSARSSAVPAAWEKP
jgi:hypothetical protein